MVLQKRQTKTDSHFWIYIQHIEAYLKFQEYLPEDLNNQLIVKAKRVPFSKSSGNPFLFYLCLFLFLLCWHLNGISSDDMPFSGALQFSKAI